MAKNLSVTINGKEYVSGEAKKAETSLVSLKDVSQKAMDGLKLGAEVAAKAFAGISVAVGAVAAATVKAADMTDQIDKMSQKIGISREAYQEWGFILSQNGMEVDKLQTGMKTLTDAAMEASLGSETYARTFETLGVSITDSNGALKDQETLFNESIKALTEVESSTARAALASDLFGRSATELAPLLNGGAGSIDNLKNKAHDLGLILGDETVDAGVVLKDTIDQLTRSFSAMSVEAIAPMMPMLTDVTNAFMGMLKGDAGSFDAFGESISGFLNTVIESLVGMAPKLVETGGQILASLVQGIGENTDQIATAVTDIVLALTDFVAQNLPMLAVTAVKIVVALGKGLVQAIPQMATSVWEMVTGMINEVMKYVPNFILLGQNLIAGLVQGVKDWAANAVDAVKDVGTKVIDGFKNLFGIHSPSTVFADFGKNMMEGLAIGISGNSGLVSTALKNAGLTPEGGNLDVSVSGTSAGGGIMGQIGGGMGEFIASLSSIQSLLDPISTILGGVMEVLGPAIDQILSPLVGILKIVGNVIGKMLIPVFQLLSPIIEFIAKAFVWFYNKAIVPVANGFITVFNAIRIGFANIINGIIRAINRIPFVNVGYVSVPGISDGTLSAIDMNTLTQAGSSGASGSSYTGGGSGSSSSVQSVNINIYQTFNGNVIGDGGMESVGEFIVDAIRAYSGVGGNVQVVSA